MEVPLSAGSDSLKKPLSSTERTHFFFLGGGSMVEEVSQLTERKVRAQVRRACLVLARADLGPPSHERDCRERFS